MDLFSGSTVNWSSYSYVLNNPINFTDPFGFWEYDPNTGGWTTTDPGEIRAAWFGLVLGQSKGLNVIVTVVEPGKEGNPGEIDKWGGATQDIRGHWIFIVSTTMTDASNRLDEALDKKSTDEVGIDNAVFQLHGRREGKIFIGYTFADWYNNGLEYTVIANTKSIDWFLSQNERPGQNPFIGKNEQAIYNELLALQSIMNKINEGGNCVFAGCRAADMDFIKALQKLTSKNIKFYLPYSYIAQNTFEQKVYTLSEFGFPESWLFYDGIKDPEVISKVLISINKFGISPIIIKQDK